MSAIPTINISTNELNYRLQNRIYTEGGESIICTTENADSLDKFFVDPNSRNQIPMPANKVEKIKRLYKMHLEQVTNPKAFITSAGTIVGYRIFKPTNYITLERANLTRKQKIKALKKSQQILENIALKDITYADIKADNILVNPSTTDVYLCDMDNVRLGNLPVDTRSRTLQILYEKYGTVDERADAYMHNLLTLQQLAFKDQIPEYYSEILLLLKRGLRLQALNNRLLPSFKAC